MSRKRWSKPVKQFQVPIYGGRVYLFKDRATWAQAREYLGLVATDEKFTGHFTSATNDDGSVVYVLGWFNGMPTTLAHEAIHLGFSILDRAGVPTTKSTDEAMAYLVDHLLKQLGLDDGWIPITA